MRLWKSFTFCIRIIALFVIPRQGKRRYYGSRRIIPPPHPLNIPQGKAGGAGGRVRLRKKLPGVCRSRGYLMRGMRQIPPQRYAPRYAFRGKNIEKTPAFFLEALFAGTPGDLLSCEASITAKHLRQAEVFITSKIWITSYGCEKAKRAYEAALKRLDMEYMDLALSATITTRGGPWRSCTRRARCGPSAFPASTRNA